MSHYRIRKGQIRGEVIVPSSKSHTLRAILFGALSTGKSVIHHYLPSPDAMAMIDACRLLGAKMDVTPQMLTIHGVDGVVNHAEDVIHAGNSGIVLRFCAAVGALAEHPVVITGDHSIRHQRPMKTLLNGLSQLGATATSMRGDGYAPVIIQGPLHAGSALLEGEDSQPVSALLIASAFAKGPIELHVRNPGEKPWVDLTLEWLRRLGISCHHENYTHYQLVGNSKVEGFEYTVPGDLSSAAFPIAAALVTQSEIILKNVDLNDSQGDKELIAVFRKMGADIEWNEDRKTLHVKKGAALQGISVDINNFVDAITILAVVACFAEGETRITNAGVARQKECNRIQCIANELRKMGADIQETEDGLWIRRSSLKGSKVYSSHDHRMVMSLSVAALGAEGDTEVHSVECVSKTFPSFVRDFHALQANIEVIA